jgi:competence protein ComGC
MYNLRKELRIIIFIVITILLGIFIVSCRTVKKTQSEVAETKTVYKTDTVTKTKTDTFRLTKTETKIETKTEIKFDTVQKDCPKNKVVYKNNGDVEVEGNIKEYTHQLSNWKNKYDSVAKELETETGKRIYFEDESKKVKTVEIVKRSNNWWLWFLIGFVLASIIAPVELIKKFFHLK